MKFTKKFRKKFKYDQISKKLSKKLTWRNFLHWSRLLGIGVLVLFVLGATALVVLAKDLPDPNRINSRLVVESTKIYDRNEVLLYEVHDEIKRTLIPFDEMPEHLKQATIAIEDREFYSHRGVSLTGILRATTRNISQGGIAEGGSSITQQLVKNALLSHEKTFTRKLRELILTVQIERSLSKDDILKLYLNEIPYGQNAYGIEAAAQTYFGKAARDLTLAESAYLAALPQRPSFLNPYGNNRDVLDNRKNHVLNNMVSLGFIETEEADAAKEEEVQFRAIRTTIRAPHFSLYVRDQLEERFGEEALRENGYKVVTTLDYEIQKMAEEAVRDGSASFDRYGATNAALVAIDPNNGEVLAMVGSKDFFDSENQGQVNVALRERQPGSSFKPYVFAAGFEKGYAPASMLMDVRTDFGGGYSPQNYNGQVYGPVSIRQALAGSLNIPAVKMLALTGVKQSIDLVKNMGITSNLTERQCGLSMVLGGCEVKLLDHTAAFSVFANGGFNYQTKSILSIEDGQGNVVFEQNNDSGRRVLSAESAYLVNDVLSDVSARAYIFGNNPNMSLSNRPSAMKTGTTQGWRDAWAMGYTPQLVTGVWVGNMDGSLMRNGADGSVVAAPIWRSFMNKALAGRPAINFQRPNGIIDIEVDRISGLLPTNATPETKVEKFASFALPEKEDPVHQLVKINRHNGLLASSKTPSEDIVTRLFKVFHSERPNNPSWENPVRAWALSMGFSYPPTEYDGGGTPIDDDNGNGEPENVLQITQPQTNNTIRRGDTFEIRFDPEYVSSSQIQFVLRNSEGQTFTLQGSGTVTQNRGSLHTYRYTWQSTSGNITAGIYTLSAQTNSYQSQPVSVIVETNNNPSLEIDLFGTREVE